MLPSIKVWPSAGLRASAAAPIVPPAPGWLSTTMVCPSLGDIYLGEGARHRVDAAARRIGRDHADLLGGPGLGADNGRRGHHQGGRYQQAATGQR